MANLFKSSGRVVAVTFDSAGELISNTAELVSIDSELIPLQLSSLRNDMKEEREAANSEEVVAIREAAAKQRAKNKALAQYIAAELERRELELEARELEQEKRQLELEKRQLELEKRQLELDRRKLSYKL